MASVARASSRSSWTPARYEIEEENQQSQHDLARSPDGEFPKLQIAWSMMARRTGFTPSRSQIAAGTVAQRT
jgi:hypothetical protein